VLASSIADETDKM